MTFESCNEMNKAKNDDEYQNLDADTFAERYANSLTDKINQHYSKHLRDLQEKADRSGKDTDWTNDLEVDPVLQKAIIKYEMLLADAVAYQLVEKTLQQVEEQYSPP